jgi:hypothetical protein
VALIDNVIARRADALLAMTKQCKMNTALKERLNRSTLQLFNLSTISNYSTMTIRTSAGTANKQLNKYLIILNIHVHSLYI